MQYIVEIIIAVIAALGAFGGSYISAKKSNEKASALMAYRLEQLESKVDKHNNLIERMYKAEEKLEIIKEKISVANHRIEDLEGK